MKNPYLTITRSATVKVDSTPSQVANMKERIRKNSKGSNLIMSLLRHGYEGHDDGLFGRLSPRMRREDFDRATAGLRVAALMKGGKDGDGSYIKPRVFYAALTGKASALGFTMAVEPITTLTNGGVLPLEELKGYSTEERCTIVENAFRRFRNFVQADQKTRTDWLHLDEVTQGLIELHEQKKLTDKELEKANRKLARKKEESNFQEYDSSEVLLGVNFVPFSLSQDGGKLIFSLEKGLFAGEYVCSYGRSKKTCYLDSLFVEEEWKCKTIRGSGGKKHPDPSFTGNYVLNYKENGKRPRVGVVREPRIYIKRVHRGRRYVDQLMISMPIDRDRLTPTAFKSDHPQFSSYYPKPLKDGFDTVRALGVDLGINPSYSYSVVEGTYPDKACSIPEFEVMSTGQSKKCNKYSEFIQETWNVLHLMKKTRSYHYRKKAEEKGEEEVVIPEEAERMIDPEAFKVEFPEDILEEEEVSEAEEAKRDSEENEKNEIPDDIILKVFPDADEYRRHAESLPDDRLKWTKKGVWVIYDKIRELKVKHGAYTHERIHKSHSTQESIAWYEASANFQKLLKSFHSTGQKDEHRLRDRGKKMTRRQKSLSNLREDARTKEARELVDLAIAQGCSVIFIENLKGWGRQGNAKRGQKVWQKRGSNRRMDLWAPSTQIDTLREIADGEGIGVIAVEKEYTSQYVMSEGVLGFRDPNDKTRLYYYDSEGTFCRINDDLNAALNIACLGLSRNAFPIVNRLTLNEKGKLIVYRGSKESYDRCRSRDRWILRGFSPEEKDKAVSSLLADRKREEENEKSARAKAKEQGKEFKDKQRKSHMRFFRHGSDFLTYHELEEFRKDIEAKIPTADVCQKYVDDLIGSKLTLYKSCPAVIRATASANKKFM